MPLSPDPEFGPAWLDADEVRDEPVPHRYVHGGFEGTNTLFRICFPLVEHYRGRMIMLLGGGFAGVEHRDDFGTLSVNEDGSWGGGPSAEPNAWLREVQHLGGFLIQSNQGHRWGIDPFPAGSTLLAYRATVHIAWYASQLAAEHYGYAPEFRYITGWSSGGDRTINMLERAPGVFHGGVGGGITTMPISQAAWSAVAEAEASLRGIVEEIAENADAGGSGDPFAATQTPEQREALALLYRVGYPFGNERAIYAGLSWSPGLSYLSYTDPDYVHDFYNVPGYAGHDGLVTPLRGEAVVREIIADPTRAPGVRLDLGPGLAVADLVGADFEVIEGAGTGTTGRFMIDRDGALSFSGLAADGTIEPGDRLSYDNSVYLAFRHYHLDAERRPAVRFVDSLEFTGRFEGKLLIVQAFHDHLAHTATADFYARQVADPSRFRLWWIENADHGAADEGLGSTRYVDWRPEFTQALADLIAWVEDGTEPAPSTAYAEDEYGIVRLPASIAERHGTQPVVTATANGARRTTAKAGETIELGAIAEAPPGSSIVEIAWDPTGTANWTTEPADGATVDARRQHVYPEPGVYRAGVRVRSRRPGTHYLIENLSHARIVIEP